MTKEELLKEIKNLPLLDVKYLRDWCKEIYRDKYNETYETIRIHPGERIEELISKETGFYCYHEPCQSIYSAGRGTHIIVIPKEKFTEELKEELVKKYDDKWD